MSNGFKRKKLFEVFEAGLAFAMETKLSAEKKLSEDQLFFSSQYKQATSYNPRNNARQNDDKIIDKKLKEILTSNSEFQFTFYAGITMSFEKLRCLKEETWLNDEVFVLKCYNEITKGKK
jgi:Ulp1 family protease